jgi:hypothetical protein
LLVVAVTVALPTLWVTALATLAAVVPLIRTPPTTASSGTMSSHTPPLLPAA